MTKAQQLRDLVGSETSRRAFARSVMVGGIGAGVAAAFGGATTAQAQSLTDVDILNFALNLEYLEAEFYTVATTGQRIADAGVGVSGMGRAGETVGGSRVAMNDRVMTVAMQIALDEWPRPRSTWPPSTSASTTSTSSSPWRVPSKIWA